MIINNVFGTDLAFNYVSAINFASFKEAYNWINLSHVLSYNEGYSFKSSWFYIVSFFGLLVKSSGLFWRLTTAFDKSGVLRDVIDIGMNKQVIVLRKTTMVEKYKPQYRVLHGG